MRRTCNLQVGRILLALRHKKEVGNGDYESVDGGAIIKSVGRLLTQKKKDPCKRNYCNGGAVHLALQHRDIVPFFGWRLLGGS